MDAVETSGASHPAADRVYATLRLKIVGGAYQPGSHLKEDVLAMEFGVSRTPVREALRHLELEGLVHLEPHRGAIVQGLTAEDVLEIFDLRAVVEGFAAGQAARRMTNEAVAMLERVVAAHERALSMGATSHVSAHSVDFHSELIKAAGNKRLTALHQLLLRIPFRLDLGYSQPAEEADLFYHREIVRAIRARDPDRAEAAMKSHVHQAKAYMVDRIGAAQMLSNPECG